jgi:hypothetical protein
MGTRVKRRISLALARPKETPIVVWLWLAFAAFAIGTILVIDNYGGLTYYPGLLSGFGASLFAFMLALRWDHERERERAQEEAHERAADRDRRDTEEHEQLVVEARRRLQPVRKELLRDQESVDQLMRSLPPAMARDAPAMAVNPQLLEGAWAANAPRLSEILSDYELVGDLAFTYGRVEELRWRLRQRTVLLATNLDIADIIARMTLPLVRELVPEIAGLIKRVDAAINDPPVRGGAVVAQIAVEVLMSSPGAGLISSQA